ncbi:MAG: UDP-N-acetylmuramate dehydrogenase [Deltaproteobacteria bacterium]|nr:UDP-N-acetylmuramate dehydrogenase [Deltaproteobacteria bacterium]
MRPTVRQIDQIRQLTRGRVQLDVPLSRLTSFKIGGPADVLVEPGGVEELSDLMRYLQDQRISRFLLGAGTNVLFHDAGFRGVVVRTSGLTGLDIQTNDSDSAMVMAAAGVLLPAVINRTCKQGLSGLEPLWGIPGSFGGAVATNAGSGGVSTGDFLDAVRLVNDAGEQITVERPDLVYGYRSMQLPERSVVVEAIVRLQPRDTEAIEADLQEARERRRSTQPLNQPCAGCVFKNPSPDNPAGAIIDRLGFKGVRSGGAMVSSLHANFIVNSAHASASDVLRLIDQIRERVKQAENIDLELEIRIIGEQVNDG